MRQTWKAYTRSANVRRMSDRDSIALKLKALRTRAKVSMDRVAKDLGYKTASSYQRYEDPTTYEKKGKHLPLHIARGLINILVGKGSPPVSQEEILMLAGVTDLTGPQLRSLDAHKLIWCVGEVAAGIWREAFELPRDEWIPVLISMQDDRYAGAQRAALQVRGDSMDQLYPDGSVVIFVRLDEIGRKPKPGDRVVVLRHRHGQTEATVKEYQRDTSKKRWLVPRSSNPAHLPFALDRPTDDSERIEIVGLVVGSQKIE